MDYVVKKSFWHRNRPVAVGENIDLDPGGAHWLVAQGKVKAAGANQESKGRRGRKVAPTEKTTEPETPAANKEMKDE
jgi:hypothetical protein